MVQNQRGASSDPKAAVALAFAAKLVRDRGHVAATDVAALKSAGYDDAQVVEIIAHVALNTLTNYINSALETEIDFPSVTPIGEYDGLCAVAMATGERVPSDATLPSRFDGRTFHFSSAEAKQMFDAEPVSFVKKADGNWSRLK
jgi:YHS domain-containing protein